MRLAAILSRGVKDGRGGGVREENHIVLHIYNAQSVLEETQELHNSQCASFYKSSAEKLNDIYEMAFSIRETLHCFKLHRQHSQPGFCVHSNYTLHQTRVYIIVVSSIHEHALAHKHTHATPEHEVKPRV